MSGSNVSLSANDDVWPGGSDTNSGNDSVLGLGGNDSIDGGAGNDTLDGGIGNDSLIGGNGTDWASYQNAMGAITFNLVTGRTNGGDGNDSLTGIENVLGGNSADTILGDGQANVLDGGDGNDSLIGGSGNDTLLGGIGNDSLDGNGGAGNDSVVGGEGMDSVSFSGSNASAAVNLETAIAITGYGNDTLLSIENVTTGGGADTVIGGVEDNFLQVAGGSDSVQGGAGNDTIFGGAGSDTIGGGAGSNLLYAGAATQTGSSADLLTYAGGTGPVSGTLAANVLDGGAITTSTFSHATGADTVGGFMNVTGSAFDDTLIGNSGTNTIEGGAGNDLLDGGGNAYNAYDNVYYADATGAVVVDLGAGTASGDWGTDTVLNFEAAIGGSGDDLLRGGAGPAHLTGGEGADTLIGGQFWSAADQSVGNTDDLRGGAGNDLLFSTGGPSANLRGGAGDDTVDGGGRGGFRFEDTTTNKFVNLNTGVATGEGNDSLVGIRSISIAGNTSDTVIGTADRQESVNPGSNTGYGNDYIDLGGTQGDSLNFFSNNGSVISFTINLADQRAFGSDGSASTIIGVTDVIASLGADTIIGNERINVFNGYGGNDSMDGGGQIGDTASFAFPYSSVSANLVTERADWTRSGIGSGTSTIIGFSGLIGSSGNDTLIGNTLTNELQGGAGNDSLDGGDGIDMASYAGAFAGVVVDLNVANQVTGGAGNDTLVNIEGVIGSNHADTLTGAGGANSITGLDGADILSGGDGNDTLVGGSGDDNMDGGDGNDLLSYAGATGGVIANLSLGFATASADTITGFESLLGSSNDDTLVGDSAANGVTGGGGNDSLSGLAGNDTLDGGVGDDTVASEAGNDSLFGGVGNDLLDYSGTGGAVTVDLGAGSIGSGAGNDLVSEFEGVLGGSGADRLLGGNADETLSGGAGNDTIAGGLGDDSLLGGDGVDWADYSGATGGVTVSLNGASGAAGSDQLSGIEHLLGGNGNDSLLGDDGANTLLGGDGVDAMSGGSGNDHDWLDFGAGNDFHSYLATQHLGNDTLFGGTGNDTLDLGASVWSAYLENPKEPPGSSPWTNYQRADGTFIYTQGWESVFCFAEGTRIMTPAGEAKVEDLRAGDMVLAMREGQAGFEALTWVGSMDVAVPRDAVMAAKTAPILIKAGALSDGMPARDLRVSPDHAIEVDGYLVPAKHLVNGTSIVQEAWCQRVRYFHLELEAHGLLLSDGLWTESYLEDGNRHVFNNAALTGLFLDFEAGRSKGQYDHQACLQVLRQGLKLDEIHGRLAIRAEDLAWVEKGRRKD